MIRVWDAAGLLSAAVAELPLGARSAPDPEGSVAVVDGAGEWGQAIRSAVAAGAIGAVVVEPTSPPAGLDGAAVPVVVVRHRMSPDEAPAAPASVIVAECSATAAALDAGLRDTVGWMRSLAGGPLRIRESRVLAGGGLALLESDGGVPVTLTVQTLSGVTEGALIRVTALGTERRQIVIDDAARVVEQTIATEGSTAVAAERFESPGRVALRRIAAALDSGERPRDLEDLAHDSAIAHRILGRPE